MEQKPLVRIKQGIKAAMSHLLSSPERNRLEAQIIKLGEDLRQEAVDLEEAEKQYEELINRYFSKFKPFSSGNKQDDLKQYGQLVKHTLVANSNSILDAWGIEYPKKNPKVLAEPLVEYTKIFKRIATESIYREDLKIPPSAKRYYEYLWKKLAG